MERENRDMEDRELIAMVNAVHDRKTCDEEEREMFSRINANCQRVKERNARLREGQAAVEYVQAPYYEERTAEHGMKRAIPAIARGFIGLGFIGGMVNGMCEPEFAMAGLGACVLWGLVNFWRSGHGEI